MRTTKKTTREVAHIGVGVIRADEVLTREALCARLRWARASYRNAKRSGLKVARFGNRDFVSGKAVLEFFDGLLDNHEADDHAA